MQMSAEGVSSVSHGSNHLALLDALAYGDANRRLVRLFAGERPVVLCDSL